VARWEGYQRNVAPKRRDLLCGTPAHRPRPIHGLAVACYIRAVPKPPPNLNIKRARVVVDNVGVKRLTVCESCGEEKYIAEGETVCDECKSGGGKIRVKRRGKLKR
jgi:hypothetical protein